MDSRNNSDEASSLAEDSLWDANDVARFLKASRSWVYQQAQAGRLPCVKIGGLLRFDPNAIRALVKA
jgi:excisionase family DNA binding protein